MARQIIINKVVGDTAPAMSFRFEGLILSVYTSVTLKMTQPDGVTKVSRTVVPDGTDDELGTVTFQSGDLVLGRSRAEFLFVESGGGEFTLPGKYDIFIDVRANNQ